MLSVFMLSAIVLLYAGCLYAECHYAECGGKIHPAQKTQAGGGAKLHCCTWSCTKTLKG
jgi:hypothetical protein